MDAPAEIVIVAPRLPEPARDEAFSIVRIDPQALAAAPRLDEALTTSPSASLFRRSSSLSANATIQGVSLRAIAPSGAGRALVTLEGAPLNDPFGGWVIWSAVPAESVSAIAIVRGAGAGPYGAGALTGVIALEEAAPPRAPLATLTLGENGYGRAAWFGGAGGFSIAAAGERYDGATPVRARAGAADVRADFESTALAGRWIGRAGQGAISARLGLHDEARGAGLAGAESASRGAHLSLTYANPNAGWRGQVWAVASDFANTSVAVSADRSTTTPANDQYETPAYGLGGTIAYRRAHGGVEWELGADARYAEGESRERFRYMGAGFTRTRAAGGESALAGVYGEASYETGPWLFTGGARFDHAASFGGRREEFDIATGAATLNEQTSGARHTLGTARFGVRRDLGAVALRAAAYSGFRPPSLNELHRPFRVGNDVTEANAALAPESLAGAEIGVDGAAWRATVFYNRLDDAIGNLTLGAGPATFPRVGFLPAGAVFRQRANLGRIEAWGLEADAAWALTPALDLRAAFAVTEAEITDAPGAPQLLGLRPAQAPHGAATLGLHWRASPALALMADARWESARWEDDLNTRRLGAGLSMDARAALRLNGRTSLELSAENLLNAAIEIGETADGVESYAPPRRLMLGLVLR